MICDTRNSYDATKDVVVVVGVKRFVTRQCSGYL